MSGPVAMASRRMPSAEPAPGPTHYLVPGADSVHRAYVCGWASTRSNTVLGSRPPNNSEIVTAAIASR